jgi:hypothetical protein
MAANPITPLAVDVPRYVWDAVNNAIHTSKIDGSVQPISLCYAAVRAALAAYVEGKTLDPDLLKAAKGINAGVVRTFGRDRVTINASMEAFKDLQVAIAKSEGNL